MSHVAVTQRLRVALVRCLAVTWPPHGRHTAVTRPSHGRHTAVTGASRTLLECSFITVMISTVPPARAARRLRLFAAASQPDITRGGREGGEGREGGQPLRKPPRPRMHSTVGAVSDSATQASHRCDRPTPMHAFTPETIRARAVSPATCSVTDWRCVRMALTTFSMHP